MGLLQKAVETFDHHEKYVGKLREGHTPLAPLSHILTSAQLEITLDQEGRFCAAKRLDKNEPKIIIPATEASAGRTSAPCAHPLCDNLGYLAPNDEKKHALYVDQLTDWADSPQSHPKLQPILRYVKGGTILADLLEEELIEVDNKGAPKNEKLLVRWTVMGLEDGAPSGCWEDPSLFTSFQNYYAEQQKHERTALCLITGENTRIAAQHPKGIIPINGNAKLISANDSSGFTYRGRFSEDWQSAEISYEASQKAHSALRWLAAEQGAQAVFGGRTFLCWNPNGKELPPVAGLFGPVAQDMEPSDYKKALQKTLDGYRCQLEDTDDAVIAVFDAATTGRLAVTYYKELRGSDFLQRLYHWDLHCSWRDDRYGCFSPSLWRIVNCSFGAQRGKQLETDERVLRQQMQRLVACRIDRAAVPADIVRSLVQRASTPLAYDPAVREYILTTACAVIRKHRYDRYKEEWGMVFEQHKEDRSFQYGCLLAVLEHVERRTYQKDESREPNAIRMQSVFCQRPLTAAATIEKQLEKAYFPRLKPGTRAYFKKMIGDICETIYAHSKEDTWDKPLEETYLLGYYLQRNELNRNKAHYVEENEHEYSEE